MKIGVTCYPSVGGSGIIATELALQMAELGHEIHFISSSVPFRLSGNVPNIYVHTVEINDYNVFKYRPYDITLASKIADVIDTQELDVIHMHYAIPHAVAGILANHMAERKVGIVTTLHGTDITVLGHDRSLERAIRFGIEKSDITTAVSESLKQETLDILHPNKDIITIYNFVDEDKFNMDNREEVKREMKKRYGIHEDTKVIMHSSNFRKIKRIDTIVRAFGEVQKHVDAVLVLVGDGPEAINVKNIIKSLGIEDKVLLVGQQSDVVSLYKMSDLFMLLSEKESFGLALLEAMNCGSVPIGSSAGGIKEVIKHGETGMIVEVGDYKAAGQYAIDLLTDENKYQKFQKAMIEDIKTRFSEEKIVGEYLETYQSLLTVNDNE
ncbi:N-acetyl-alpha-D-glucosaminyl L-malate synthase BshA [Phocicoccus pinnipedialis]|uniref:GDP-mannose-dependent alpha-(1-6)-phosphatidylinositol monomannoside mannosyltransferase n=1 Tax=Phocicoccus pinnipedialis TaxID=110845 RepID=A0A6V7RF31_9BACL|nr:N-acetyl-alpha-D-glucosaminyl L-malate synthase BshA [Jeotgalicoccus pinnipedialis]MBP1939379.1 N-acetyl-alpha-D-glucosaminyl L-malate synthase BshA [Jeotgalicoccus pinnipedialis]CAD2075602.1 GDP-mannose-dependent alpha-(1-6)-phosphatidylinositol monomannoside mannosyltransferase [Jeotgalicoccus pinnipedialis]